MQTVLEERGGQKSIKILDFPKKLPKAHMPRLSQRNAHVQHQHVDIRTGLTFVKSLRADEIHVNVLI